MDGLKSLCSTQHLIRNLNGIKVVEWGNMQLGKHPTRLILVITPPYIRMGMITSSIISSSTSAEGSTPFYVTFPCAPLTGGAWSIASCHVPKPSFLLIQLSHLVPAASVLRKWTPLVSSPPIHFFSASLSQLLKSDFQFYIDSPL